jgi:hypothetical protein
VDHARQPAQCRREQLAARKVEQRLLEMSAPLLEPGRDPPLHSAQVLGAAA